MNKTELITAMAEASGLTKKDCDTALNAFVDTLQTALKSGDKVQLLGFGTFEVKERAARSPCRNFRCRSRTAGSTLSRSRYSSRKPPRTAASSIV